jgi:hypothetical protein
MITKAKRPFNKRAFVSIAMFAAGLVLPFSGFMNHVLQFEQLTRERHFWMTVHNVTAILFAVFAIIHVVYNWRSLLHYAKKAKEVCVSREAIFAFILVAFIVGLFSSHVFHAG